MNSGDTILNLFQSGVISKFGKQPSSDSRQLGKGSRTKKRRATA
jgi:hypothetical protein